MKKNYTIILLLGLFQTGFGQTAPDSIYQTDRSFISAFVDEITADQVVYFLPSDKAQTKPERIQKDKVWKIVYANGETETLNQPESVLLALDKILLRNGTELIGRVTEVKPKSVLYEPSSGKKKLDVSKKDINKIVYADGREDLLNEPEPTKLPETDEELAKTGTSSDSAKSSDKKGLFGKRNKDKKETLNSKPADNEPINVPVKEPELAAAPAKSNEIVIKIQHENVPANSYENRDENIKQKYRNYVGFRFGGLATSFYEDKITKPDKPLYGWETGLGISLFNSKHYNARLELIYANKGAIQVFSGNGIEITSRNKLAYFQGNLLPIIFKTGARKLNPVIGLGGYYAYLFKHTSQYKEGKDDFEDDEATSDLINNKYDYGMCAMLGFYNGAKPLLEFRYEYGLSEIMKGLNVKNHGLSVSLFLSF